jgi:hypothetical protein
MDKRLIHYGLEQLLSTTHLVGSQVKSNMDAYLENLDESIFVSKIGGSPRAFLGSGVFGAVFRLDNGKTLKITFDHKEAPFVYVYCCKQRTDGFVVVDKMYEASFGNSKCFYIVREPIEKIAGDVDEVILDYKRGKRHLQYDDALKAGVSKALQAMYNLDDNWRGTHAANIALQHKQVVLYDGFSKKINTSASIPKL